MHITFFMEKSKRTYNFDFKANILCENPSISSTVSSPGYNTKGEINPSTYSFTTAIKALQAKTVYLSPEHGGFSLNSKWNDAEKYICNPLSGRVPLECLSSKTLSGRLVFRGGVTLSPVGYRFPAKPGIADIATLEKGTGEANGDGGTRSELSSIRGPSTPSIEEGSVAGDGDSWVCSEEVESEAEVVEVEVKETGEKLGRDKKRKGRKRVMKMMTSCGHGGGCLALRNFVRRHRAKNKTVDNPTSPAAFVCHINASFRK